MKILDTHLHLLYPDSLSYGWTRDHEALSGPAPVEVFEALDSRGHIAAALMMEADVDEPQIEREIDVIGEVVARDDNPGDRHDRRMPPPSTRLARSPALSTGWRRNRMSRACAASCIPRPTGCRKRMGSRPI